jgi:chromosome segregation ATPase
VTKTATNPVPTDPAEADLRDHLARLNREVVEAERRHAAARADLTGSLLKRFFGRTPILEEKAKNLARALAEVTARRDEIRAKVDDLDREAALPSDWREARARLRKARAAAAGAAPVVSDGEREVAAAEAELSRLALAARSTREKALVDRRAAARAHVAALMDKIDTAYGGLVALAVEVERACEELRELGAQVPQVLNDGWSPAALASWRRIASREKSAALSAAR